MRGSFFDELQETRMEKMKDQIFQETGGRVGQDYSPHTRTAKAGFGKSMGDGL